jgi:hypothetical protein
MLDLPDHANKNMERSGASCTCTPSYKKRQARRQTMAMFGRLFFYKPVVANLL